ncbi:MAG: peptide chain release factor N(5)-glutamine methyltransferase [Coriobacteriaceae bacterium]|nr:peptide chain release factor N(5)-glutamine methyltransferase [Coriobacteriaceae bacterium]
MADDTWTVQAALDWCRNYLQAHDDENPRRSAEVLLADVTGLSRVELYAYFDRPLSDEERADLREALKRRGQGEPLQYVVGETGFRHIIVQTAKGVLIPRPETEVLVGCVLDWAAAQKTPAAEMHVLEVGCGTGCIACSLAKEAGMQVVATDIAPEALECTRRNVETLHLDDLVEIRESDCATGIDGAFDILISNPPYIPTDLLEEIPAEVADFEPRLALDGGADGLDFFRRLLPEADRLLRSGGLLACELHETTLEEASELAGKAGLVDISVTEDLAGKPRVLLACRR